MIVEVCKERQVDRGVHNYCLQYDIVEVTTLEKCHTTVDQDDDKLQNLTPRNVLLPPQVLSVFWTQCGDAVVSIPEIKK